MEDLPYIADLLCQETGKRDVNQIERDLKDPNYIYYCLTDEYGIICSYMSLLVSVDTADVVLIITDANKRGRGFGTQLLKFALNELRKEGFKNVILEVRADNEIAKHLYNKFGFIPISIRKNYYGTSDGIVMKLSL